VHAARPREPHDDVLSQVAERLLHPLLACRIIVEKHRTVTMPPAFA